MQHLHWVLLMPECFWQVTQSSWAPYAGPHSKGPMTIWWTSFVALCLSDLANSIRAGGVPIHHGLCASIAITAPTLRFLNSSLLSGTRARWLHVLTQHWSTSLTCWMCCPTKAFQLFLWVSADSNRWTYRMIINTAFHALMQLIHSIILKRLLRLYL
mmetsp:Transcript_43624/g.125933  ORF Transcript_43624/g.125933 Transcript_43624/m.125933 type:complete len:157 (+) Transcript_43624:82-552(+)